MLVDVYRNLNKNCWSIRDSKTRRVILHAQCLALQGATFHVSGAGRQRVLREQRKNVHAYVRGELVPELVDFELHGSSEQHRASYNPYKHGHFFLVWDEDIPIRSARWVRFTSDGHVLLFMAT